MLEKEFAFFTANRSQLIEEYNGKFIVIVGEEVKGSFESKLDALKEGVDKFGLGKFFIEFCTKDENFYNWTFANLAYV
ncbi:MAG: hypothetical protein Q7J16_04945 [Candidatus Cloacimonadales bacterium]|nr:hypothetical protein [Candidatus Cloacimonadales bacterium]